MNIENIFDKALKQEAVSKDEALYLYQKAALSDMIFIANEIRKALHPENAVGWIIDRNMNITNVCMSQCLFCNFCRKKNDGDAYITSKEEYQQKIDELFLLGGSQLLLQGGMHPGLGLDFYVDLFKTLKTRYPSLKLHALGPPEIVFIAKMEKKSVREILEKLIEAGLDSLPGAGAEILSDRVKKIISPAKCRSQEWLDVMREAHKLNLPTSATMMFGHIETPEERVGHLIQIREVQDEKPRGTYGFLSFIPWPFQHAGTLLNKKLHVVNTVTDNDYLRFIALSRIVLNNIANIQPSWLTVGVPLAQVCLHAGGNDFGSVMIEEHVVSQAGASHWLEKNQMVKAIIQAGFVPKLRNQKFEYF
ncbi:MAG TPA: cyclic dehypoxanthinyl futalosine synthase [Bacteroidales bacterium]|nr:cyclic dehypoxanthinyl futalosine synthase [Bacteroidales bacterium]